jgi:hypothetical protein
MQTQSLPMRHALGTRAVPGKHVRDPKTARRILVTAFLIGAAAAGSVAATGHGATNAHVNGHHAQSAVTTVRNPWMY